MSLTHNQMLPRFIIQVYLVPRFLLQYFLPGEALHKFSMLHVPCKIGKERKSMKMVKIKAMSLIMNTHIEDSTMCSSWRTLTQIYLQVENKDEKEKRINKGTHTSYKPHSRPHMTTIHCLHLFISFKILSYFLRNLWHKF